MAGTTRQIGAATRIYRNSSSEVLAVDDIAILSDTFKIGDGKFHRSANKRYKRIIFNLAVADRVVAFVQMVGDYTSIETDAGDYLTAEWADPTGDANDISISFGDLKKLGDTL